MTALMEAVNVGNYAEVAGVRELLANETVVEALNVRNRANWTALDIAKRLGCRETIKLLMEAQGLNAEVAADAIDQFPRVVAEASSCTSEEGSFLVWNAIIDGHLNEIIEILTNYREIVEVADEFGNTPLHFAAIQGNVDTLRMLLVAGANVEATDVNSETPLMIAARHGRSIEMVRSLLSRGADVNAVRADGWTPLMLASKTGGIEIVKLLLQRGASVNARSTGAGTALSVAALGRHC